MLPVDLLTEMLLTNLHAVLKLCTLPFEVDGSKAHVSPLSIDLKTPSPPKKAPPPPPADPRDSPVPAYQVFS